MIDTILVVIVAANLILAVIAVGRVIWRDHD